MRLPRAAPEKSDDPTDYVQREVSAWSTLALQLQTGQECLLETAKQRQCGDGIRRLIKPWQRVTGRMKPG
jgi:hypothetical protein